MEKSFSAGAIDNGSSGNRHERAVLLVMTFGFVLALYCKNIFVILTGPFMYSILENFVLSILRLEKYRLVVSFDPTTVSPQAVSMISFLVGPIVLGIVTGLTAFLLSKKNAVVTI